MIIRTKPAPSGARKWVAFSCSHCPLQDLEAVELVKEAIKDFRPDTIIHLGDLHEAASASVWPNEYDFTWSDELASASAMLREIRLAHHEPEAARCVFLPGNHDKNVEDLARHPKATRNVLSWRVPQFVERKNGAPLQINAEFLDRWKIVADYRHSRKRGIYRIGATVFAHGYECHPSSDEDQAVQLGWPYGLFVSGHTHRPTPGFARQAMKTRTLPLPYWYLNAGTTADLYPAFMRRRRASLWGHAVVYGWSLPVNSPRLRRDTWDAFCEPGKRHESAF